MTMSYKIFSFFNKIGDIFPVGGGAVGAASQAKQFDYLPTWEAVIATIIITVIGAIFGYLIKLGLDIVFSKIKKKYKV
jgi:hypothetical protein